MIERINIKEVPIKETLHNLILLLVTLVISSYFVSEYLVDYQVARPEILMFRQFLQVGTIFSMITLAFYVSLDFRKQLFIKLGVSTIIYWLVSYFLLLTQNINNIKFKVFDILGNSFFELGGLSYVAIILVLALLFHMVSPKFNLIDKINKLFYDYTESDFTISLLVSLIVIQDSKLLDKLKQFLFLTNDGNLSDYLADLVYKVPIIVVTITLITYAFWDSIRGIMRRDINLSLVLLSSLLFSLIFNYTIQYGIRIDEDYLGLYIFPAATLFQILILSLIYLSLYVLLNRYLLATFLIVFLGIAISIANHIKFIMRSEPLLFTDLAMVNQLGLIFRFVDWKLLVVILLISVVLVSLNLVLRKKVNTEKIFISIKNRLIFTISIFSILCFILFIFFNQESGQIPNGIPVLSRLNNTRNISFTGHATTARFQSLMYVWIKQLTRPIMEKPESYDEVAIQKIVEKYSKRADEINKTRTENINDQTIIFILSESLSDPSRIKGVTLTNDILKNIKQVSQNTTSGIMKSDAYGGGTANIEIQTLLGLPLYNLSSSIAIYNTEVVPKMKVLPSISDEFLPENRYVIHLGETKLYSRLDVYSRLKFHSFIADDSNAIKPSVNTKYGEFPSDVSTYQNVLDKLDPTKRQFFSVITYQNHTPWSMSEPAEIGGKGENFTDAENERLSHYARLVSETDRATKEFLDELSKRDEKITVVFYGDHLPGFYPKSTFSDNPENQYLTDYFIWSNKNNEKKDYPKINSSDFPAALLSHTNSKVTPYYALLTDVLENASIDVLKMNQEQQVIANDLKLIQYDLISGKSYLKNYSQFFDINN